MKTVVVTGMGIVSAIGSSVTANLHSLQSNVHGLSKPAILKTKHQFPVGEIKLSNAELLDELNLSANSGITRASLLGIKAITEIFENIDIEPDPENTAFVSGTSVGGIDKTEEYFDQFDENVALRTYIQAQHPGYTTQKIAEYFGIKEHITTISTACSSSANAIMNGARLIQSGRFSKVIVGGSDCLTKFTLNGFNSLRILSEKPARPFDINRNGLNLGEAAAYLVLEAESNSSGQKVIAKVSGAGNANDAYHQTASSENGEGAYKAMTAALRSANLNASQIDYINAHGTGTQNNDLAETNALKRVFAQNEVPDFSSTKVFTGHTLGAAGAVEAIYSILSLQNQQLFANLNFQDMMENGLVPITQKKHRKLDHVMSNSFGFGGNCTSLIFSKHA
ncbi:beta-ketoacyl-[acyl-carrier-protein] synthase family protein [Christiangramia sp. ASW11-125]|uniref:beta-ketoacyl-[acyl-carrier-protein] synthase family protein n=1 Tax=Christiangramia sp. ASW11-125 TaxID=3400701 RepID=UPI003AAD04E4